MSDRKRPGLRRRYRPKEPARLLRLADRVGVVNAVNKAIQKELNGRVKFRNRLDAKSQICR